MLNRVILIGRLGQDPELRYTPSGVAFTNFRIAVKRNYKNQQGEVETDWIPVVAWRQLAETIGQHLKKGRLVAVDGRLQSRTYQTKEGENRTVYDVVAEDVRFLDSSGKTGSVSPPAATTDEQAPPGPPDSTAGGMDDDIPF